MAEVTLKCAEVYMLRCPLCGTFDFENQLRYPDVTSVGVKWVKCSRCGTTYKRVWQAAGSDANIKAKEEM